MTLQFWIYLFCIYILQKLKLLSNETVGHAASFNFLNKKTRRMSKIFAPLPRLTSLFCPNCGPLERPSTTDINFNLLPYWICRCCRDFRSIIAIASSKANEAPCMINDFYISISLYLQCPDCYRFFNKYSPTKSTYHKDDNQYNNQCTQ